MSYFFDRKTSLRWHIVNRAATSAAAAEAVKTFAAENTDSEWRQPTFEEAIEQLGKDEHFSFDDTVDGLWVAVGEDKSKPGVDVRQQTFVAEESATDLAVVVVSIGQLERPAQRKQKKFTVVGYIDSPTFQKCDEAAAYLNVEYASEYNIVIEKVFAFEYEKLRATMIAEGKIADTHSVVVSCLDDNVHTDGESFIDEMLRTTDFRLFELPDDDANSYTQLAKQNLIKFLRSTGSKYCWMMIKIGDMIQGKIVFQLHSSELPRTCENFMHLCRGDLPDAEGENGEKIKLHYKGTNFYRVVKNGWVQGGDIVGKDKGGNSGYSVYGKHFPDESFKIPHDGPGVLGMANDGQHSNSSSFYITTSKSSWMTGKYVAFGRVVEGLSVVEAIHNIETKHNQGPVAKIIIEDCGYLSMD